MRSGEPERPLPNADTLAFIAAVREEVAAFGAGRVVAFEAVRRWLLSWGADAELPRRRVAAEIVAACDRLEHFP